MGVIYKLTSPSGKIYVGKTYNLRKRVNSHKASIKKDKNYVLINSIRKHGWDNHFLEVIEEVEDDLLNDREIYWIKELNTYYQDNDLGMNMTRGGDGQRCSWMHKTEQRKQQSERYTSDGNPFYGHKHSDESKDIMSEKAKIRNKDKNINIPEWGVEKGRLAVIRACIVYGSDGVLIGEYDSLTNCANKLGVKLGTVKDSVLYGSWIDGRYLVRYKLSDEYLLRMEVKEIKTKTVKRAIRSISPDGLEKLYPSAKEASDELGIPKTTINRAAQYNNGKAIRSGHVFFYQDK